MAVQSGLFKLLLPLPNVPQSSLARRMAPKKSEQYGGSSEDASDDSSSAVLFLLHPKQPLSIIAVSVFFSARSFLLTL